MALYQAIDRCRSCGFERLAEVLNLGHFAVSDFLESPDDFTDKAPLELVRCEGCSLVQLRHTVDRDRLYKKYWYRSSTQPAMVSALQTVVADAMERAPLQRGDVVLDIGANDGTLLRMYPEGIHRIAFEPAENLWPLLQGISRDPLREISHVYGYFPQVVGGRVVGLDRPAKIITSIACFYDVDDPNQFVEGIKACLAPDGIWINQMAHLPDTLRAGNFGDICHEHLTYWTVESFAALLHGTGLYLNDYSYNDVNGGSVRTVVSWQESWYVAGRLPDADPFYGFAARISQQRRDVIKFLSNHTGIVGYGASTKGNTYLQYWGVTPNLVECIADRNPEKWGKYTPTGQRIISEEEMRAMKPSFLLVLPWHFAEAFVERERDLLAEGTRMLIPFPKLHLIGGRSDADLLTSGPQAGSRAAD